MLLKNPTFLKAKGVPNIQHYRDRDDDIKGATIKLRKEGR